MVEGDSEIIICNIINSDLSLALHGHLIQDVKFLVSHFSCINFSHVCCQGNAVAHSFARREILSPNLLV